MATTPQAPPSQAPFLKHQLRSTIHTAQLITAMLKSNGHVSDLIFSPDAPRKSESAVNSSS
jgi:hypothetical protein